MAQDDTGKIVLASDGQPRKPESHPGFGKGFKHPGMPRFPGRTAARRRRRRGR